MNIKQRQTLVRQSKVESISFLFALLLFSSESLAMGKPMDTTRFDTRLDVISINESPLPTVKTGPKPWDIVAVNGQVVMVEKGCIQGSPYKKRKWTTGCTYYPLGNNGYFDRVSRMTIDCTAMEATAQFGYPVTSREGLEVGQVVQLTAPANNQVIEGTIKWLFDSPVHNEYDGRTIPTSVGYKNNLAVVRWERENGVELGVASRLQVLNPKEIKQVL